MLKNLLIFFFGLMVFQTVHAAPADTLLFYLKNSGEVVASRDSADYSRLIMTSETDSDKNLYKVHDFYLSGTPKFVGTSLIRSPSLMLDGACISYYPNGHRENTRTYKNGKLIDNIVSYYPNGKAYLTYKLDEDGKQEILECRDSTGNILAQNGSGHVLIFDAVSLKLIEEGDIKNMMKEGEWKGHANDTISYVCLYHKNTLKSGNSVTKSGAKYTFKNATVPPVFDGGIDGLYSFLKSNLIYPQFAKERKLNGSTIVGFTITNEGMVKGVRIVMGQVPSFNEEAMRVMKFSPIWTPGLLYGVPTDMQQSVTVFFNSGYIQFGTYSGYLQVGVY